MSSTTVRVTRKTWEALRETAARTGMTMQEILDKSIEEYRRKRFLEETNNAFQVLKDCPAKWEEELRERRLWDQPFADALEEK